MTMEPGVPTASDDGDFGALLTRWPKPLRIRAQAILLSVVPVAFLLILLSIALLIQQVTISAGDWSKRSEQNLAQSARVMEGLTAASRAITEYASKHREADLLTYDRAVWVERTDLSRLESLALTPEQRRRARRLAASVTDGMRLLETYRRLEISGQTDRAKALAAKPSTQALGMKIQRDADAFDIAQRELTLQHIGSMRAVIWRYELALIVCCVLGILCSLYMTVRFGFSIVSRLRRLERNVARLGQGESSEPIAGSDEIAALDRAYHAMTRRVEQERAVASLLQRALLPQNLPDISGIRLETAYLPAAQETEVGGDWYDVFELSANVIGISIGDVGGHGVRAAAVMGAARQAIRTAAYIDSDPAQVLRRVNKEACVSADSTPLTAFFATLDLRDGAFRHSVAGHPLPLVLIPGAT